MVELDAAQDEWKRRLDGLFAARGLVARPVALYVDEDGWPDPRPHDPTELDLEERQLLDEIAKQEAIADEEEAKPDAEVDHDRLRLAMARRDAAARQLRAVQAGGWP